MRILLLSGGGDSMLLYQRDYGFDKYVFFDYGQAHKEKEFSICSNIITNVFNVRIINKGKEYCGRNLFFITTLLSAFGDSPLDIYIGTNAEDKYPDNNREFFDKVENLILNISMHPLRIITPLIHMTKADILKELKLPYYTD